MMRWLSLFRETEVYAVHPDHRQKQAVVWDEITQDFRVQKLSEEGVFHFPLDLKSGQRGASWTFWKASGGVTRICTTGAVV